MLHLLLGKHNRSRVKAVLDGSRFAPRGSTGRYWRVHACPRESLRVHLEGGSTRVPRGSRAGPFCNDFTFCPVLEGCGTHPARVPCSSKKSCCLRGAGRAAPHSSLRVHLEAMWPNCVARVHAGLAGPFHQEAMWPSHCVARVHVGPRGSTWVLEEAGGSIYKSLVLLRRVRNSPLYGVGPRGSRAGRQCCLRGGEAITGVGPRGSCAVPAGPAQVTRPSRPRGSIPSGSDVAQSL